MVCDGVKLHTDYDLDSLPAYMVSCPNMFTFEVVTDQCSNQLHGTGITGLADEDDINATAH